MHSQAFSTADARLSEAKSEQSRTADRPFPRDDRGCLASLSAWEGRATRQSGPNREMVSRVSSASGQEHSTPSMSGASPRTRRSPTLRTLSGKKDEHPAPPGHQGRHAFREDAPGFGKVPFREEHPLRRSRGAGAPGRHYAGDLVLGYRQEGMGIRGQVIRDREGQCAIFAKRPGKSFREGGETAPVEGAVPTGTGHSRPDRGEAVFVQASGSVLPPVFPAVRISKGKGGVTDGFLGDTPRIHSGRGFPSEYRSIFFKDQGLHPDRPDESRAPGLSASRMSAELPPEGPPPPGTTPPDP